MKDNKVYWQCVEPDRNKAVAGLFQVQAKASEGYDFLPLAGLDPDKFYSLSTRPQSLFLKRFGGLVNHLLPFTLDPDGILLRTVGKYYCLTDCVEKYSGYGDMFMSGVRLSNQFMGTWYNPGQDCWATGARICVSWKRQSSSMGKTEPPTEKAEPPVEKLSLPAEPTRLPQAGFAGSVGLSADGQKG